MTQPLLLGIGGAHIDRRGRTDRAFVPGASNPGTMREEAGGGALNALRAARLHGCAAMLVSVRGGDSAGEMVARAIAQGDIADRSAVFLDRPTPSYTAILDEHGDVVAALADMGLYEVAFERHLRRLGFREAAGKADAFLLDANLPEGAIRRVIDAAGSKPVHAIAVSPAKAVRHASFLSRLTGLFMNTREAAALSGVADAAGAASWFRAAGLAHGAMTAGGSPLVGFDGQGIFRILPPAPDKIADVTGAGDALAGATAAHLLLGRPFREALRAGVAAATLTVESEGATATFTEQAFQARLALVPEPEAVP